MDKIKMFLITILFAFLLPCISNNIIDMENWFNWFYSSIDELRKWMEKPPHPSHLTLFSFSPIFNLSSIAAVAIIIIPFSTHLTPRTWLVLIYYSVNIILFHSIWKPSNSYTTLCHPQNHLHPYHLNIFGCHSKI